MNDYDDWFRELLTTCNALIDHWENDIAPYVNTLRELLEEAGERDPS